LYGEYTHELWREWIGNTSRRAQGYLHLHPNVHQDRWIEEFSQYDAGWLHVFQSANGGDLRRANWDDLNLPARISVLAAAGLPMLQRNNSGHTVATQSLTRRLGAGVFFEDLDDLGRQVHDGRTLPAARANVVAHRGEFTFDAHADRLAQFFRTVIASASRSDRRASA
jgi:hypothetical protein